MDEDSQGHRDYMSGRMSDDTRWRVAWGGVVVLVVGMFWAVPVVLAFIVQSWFEPDPFDFYGAGFAGPDYRTENFRLEVDVHLNSIEIRGPGEGDWERRYNDSFQDVTIVERVRRVHELLDNGTSLEVLARQMYADKELAEHVGPPIGTWLHDPKAQGRIDFIEMMVDDFGLDFDRAVHSKDCWASRGMLRPDGWYKDTENQALRDEIFGAMETPRVVALRGLRGGFWGTYPVDVAACFGNEAFIGLLHEKGRLSGYSPNMLEELARVAEELGHGGCARILREAAGSRG